MGQVRLRQTGSGWIAAGRRTLSQPSVCGFSLWEECLGTIFSKFSRHVRTLAVGPFDGFWQAAAGTVVSSEYGVGAGVAQGCNRVVVQKGQMVR
jgi:hypothetical protein